MSTLPRRTGAPVARINEAPVKWLLLRAQISRYGTLLKRLWWVPVLTTLVGLGISFLVISQAPPSYLSVARMMVSGRVNLTNDINAGYTEELQNFFGTQMNLMTSGEVRNGALDRVKSIHPELTPVPVDYSAGQEPKTSIFQLRAVGSDGPFVQTYLDACMDEYVRTKKAMRSEKAGMTLAALNEELKGVEGEMKGTEDNLLTFQQQNNLGYLKEEGNSAAVYLATLNRQYADLKTEYTLLSTLDLEQNLERQPGVSNPAAASSTAQDPFLFASGPGNDFLKGKQQLKLLQAEREKLAGYMRPQHPDLARLDSEIAQTNRIIDGFRSEALEQLESRRNGLKVQMDNLTNVIKDWETKAVELSRRIAEYEKMRSNLDRLKAQYDRLFSNTRSLDINRSLDQDMVSILERASSPFSVKPGLPKALAAGLVGGLLVGCLILFIIDRVDDRLSSILDVNMHFSEQVLGQVMEEAHAGADLQLLQAEDSRHGFAESFRNFRSSLLFMPFEGDRPKTLLVTSAIPNEGKSTITSNLAIALAQSGSRVLLVDCDLRRGALHRPFKVPNEKGFSEVIMGLVPAEAVTLKTAYPNLSIIPRGRSTTKASEHLLSPITDHFLQDVYPKYDHIIFDSSPVLVSDDTTSFAPKVDAVIAVVRFNHSSSRLTRRVIELLKHRQANVIGLVINAVDSSTPEYGYYKYKDYYAPKEAESN